MNDAGIPLYDYYLIDIDWSLWLIKRTCQLFPDTMLRQVAETEVANESHFPDGFITMNMFIKVIRG